MAGADYSLSLAITASNSAGAALSGLIGSLGPIGGAVAVVGAALVGVGVVAVKMAADYEQGMNKIQALTGSSNAQMSQYDAGLKKLAVDAGVAPTALADGLYNVISAGYAGGDAMKMLTLATEDAKIGMTDSGTTAKALTNVMANFNVKIGDATRVNGEMLQTVTLGKATFADYANNITKAAGTSAQFGVSMETMNAAWATLTANGISAGQATTDYDQSLKVMYGNIGTVTKSLNKNGIAFNEAKFNSLDYGGKIQMLNAALEEANKKHIKVTGATMQASQAIKEISDHIKMYNNDLDSLSNKQAMTNKTAQAWAITQNGLNQQISRAKAAFDVLMISIGQQLLPVLTQLASAVTPIITAFTQWLTAGDHMKMVAIALGAVIAALLLPVMISLAASVIAATWPFLLVAAAVGALVAIFLHFYNTNAGFKSFINGIGAALKQVWSVITANFAPAMKLIGNLLQQVGAYVVSTFKPVWDQLVTTFKSEMIPTWNSLVKAIQPILPELKQFGEFLLGTVGVAITLVIGLIGGLIHGMASMLSGMIEIVSGIIQVFSGAVKVISGIIALIVDLATGNFSKLGTDLGTIFDGIGTMIAGVWTMIKGVFQASIGAVIGFMAGFVQTIIGIVQNLSTTLVGHSIIPDMVNAIVSWFAQLPGRAISAVQSLVGLLTSFFANLAAQAVTWGVDLIQNLINGITSMLGNLSGAVGNVANTIASMLHFTKPDKGPLKTVDEWMPHLGDTLILGLNNISPKLQSAAIRAAAAVAGPIKGSTDGSMPSHIFDFIGSNYSGYASGMATTAKRQETAQDKAARQAAALSKKETALDAHIQKLENHYNIVVHAHGKGKWTKADATELAKLLAEQTRLQGKSPQTASGRRG